MFIFYKDNRSMLIPQKCMRKCTLIPQKRMYNLKTRIKTDRALEQFVIKLRSVSQVAFLSKCLMKTLSMTSFYAINTLQICLLDM